MNWALFFQLLVTAIVALLGTLLGHYLNSKRDRTNAKRDQRIAFLIDAYRRIEFISDRPSIDDPQPIESAFADIQLFGSAKQVELVQEVMKQFAITKNASMNAMLTELRQDLRKELQLDLVPDELLFFRFPPKENKNTPPQATKN